MQLSPELVITNRFTLSEECERLSVMAATATTTTAAPSVDNTVGKADFLTRPESSGLGLQADPMEVESAEPLLEMPPEPSESSTVKGAVHPLQASTNKVSSNFIAYV